MSARTWATDDCPARRHDLEVVDVGDEQIVWDPVRDRVHRLDPVGVLLWSFLDGETPIADLAADVADVWGIDVEQATQDLLDLVRRLDEAALLVGSKETLEPLDRPVTEGYLSNPPVP